MSPVREEMVVVVDAVDRRFAGTRAARIPPDDVEVVEQRLAVDLVGVQGEVGASETGASRVDEQAADPLLRLRQMPGDVQLEVALRWIGVVDRRRERADLDPSGITDRRPAERIVGRIERRVAVLGVGRRHRRVDTTAGQ